MPIMRFTIESHAMAVQCVVFVEKTNELASAIWDDYISNWSK